MRIIRSLEKCIIRYWFWIVVGCIAEKKAIDAMLVWRGYSAIGSEFMILPFFLMTGYCWRKLRELVTEYLENRDAND